MVPGALDVPLVEQNPPPLLSSASQLLKGHVKMGKDPNERTNGSRRKNGLQKYSGGWEGFIDLELSAEQKLKLASLEGDDLPDLAGFLSMVLDDGYKFSAVVDQKHHCTIATLTGKGEGCVNLGYSLSARGPDLQGALLVLHFKHVVMCEEQRWSGHESAASNQMSLWG